MGTVYTHVHVSVHRQTQTRTHTFLLCWPKGGVTCSDCLFVAGVMLPGIVEEQPGETMLACVAVLSFVASASILFFHVLKSRIRLLATPLLTAAIFGPLLISRKSAVLVYDSEVVFDALSSAQIEQAQLVVCIVIVVFCLLFIGLNFARLKLRYIPSRVLGACECAYISVRDPTCKQSMMCVESICYVRGSPVSAVTAGTHRPVSRARLNCYRCLSSRGTLDRLLEQGQDQLRVMDSQLKQEKIAKLKAMVSGCVFLSVFLNVCGYLCGSTITNSERGREYMWSN